MHVRFDAMFAYLFDLIQAKRCSICCTVLCHAAEHYNMSNTATLVKMTPDPLDLQQVTNFVQDDGAGAIATFSGVTRNSFNGNKVIQLEYEAYDVMAEKVLQVCISSLTKQNARQCSLAAMWSSWRY